MKKLSREELKSVTGGVAAIIDCCVHISSDGVNCDGESCGHGPADGIEVGQAAAAEGYYVTVLCNGGEIWTS